jgi:hypothetical protein
MYVFFTATTAFYKNKVNKQLNPTSILQKSKTSADLLPGKASCKELVAAEITSLDTSCCANNQYGYTNLIYGAMVRPDAVAIAPIARQASARTERLVSITSRPKE